MKENSQEMRQAYMQIRDLSMFIGVLNEGEIKTEANSWEKVFRQLRSDSLTFAPSHITAVLTRRQMKMVTAQMTEEA